MRSAIQAFTGEHRWLSNFWPAYVMLDQHEYRSVEHAYQAAKTLHIKERGQIQRAATASDAKRLGRTVTMRLDWNEMKLAVMQDLVKKKFNSDHPELRQLLRNTGDAELIESNYWNDTFWGVCRGRGENHLGRILMAVRKEL